jgi:hypothetical protein
MPRFDMKSLSIIVICTLAFANIGSLRLLRIVDQSNRHNGSQVYLNAVFEMREEEERRTAVRIGGALGGAFGMAFGIPVAVFIRVKRGSPPRK